MQMGLMRLMGLASIATCAALMACAPTPKPVVARQTTPPSDPTPADGHTATIDAMAAKLFEAFIIGDKTPLSSTRMGATFDLEQARQVQRAFVQRRAARDRVVGFKAGLTSQALQTRFATDAPIAGVLFESGRVENQHTLNPTASLGLHIELEIAFVVGSPIDAPLPSREALARKISGLGPALEFPCLNFAGKPGVTDLVASNVGACFFMMGKSTATPPCELDTLTATLTHQGPAGGSTVVAAGRGADVMGDPWQAALWLVNHLVAQGHTLEAGNVLLSGAMVAPVPAAPGDYVADFGTLGRLHFAAAPVP